MPGSPLSFVSTFARSGLSLRFAAIEVTFRPVALDRRSASTLIGASLRATRIA